jgi:DNA-binding transcriptional ArsR family regulator
MFVLLDVVTGVSDAASGAVAGAEQALQSPIVAYIAMAASVLGPIAGIAGAARHFSEKTRQRNYKAIGPTDPMPIVLPDPERIAILARLAQAERETAEFRAIWKRDDDAKRLAEAVEAMEALRNALTRERELNAALKLQNGELRLEKARLQLELDSAPVLDVTPLEDISARIPTPMLPPLTRRPP